MKLLTLPEVADLLGVAPSSLADKRFRARLGLNVVKIGKLVRFQESDIERIIRRGRQKLPALAETGAAE